MDFTALFAQVRSCWAKGEYHVANRLLDQIEAIDPQGEDYGKYLLFRATVATELGEARMALELYQQFLSLIPTFPQFELWRGIAWHNMGVAFRIMRRYPDAIDAYEAACQCYQTEAMAGSLCGALQNLAWVCCRVGRFLRAESALAESKAVCQDDEDHWQQTLAEAYLAQAQGQDDRALTLCQPIMEQPDLVPAEIASQASWIAGRVALSQGGYEAAEQLALLAADYATRAVSGNRCLQDASELRSEALRLRVQRAGA